MSSPLLADDNRARSLPRARGLPPGIGLTNKLPFNVTTLSKGGRLTVVKTLGGHRCYYWSEVEAPAAPQVKGAVED